MKPKEFLEQLNEDQVVAAIAAAERGTTGEIRVFISGRRLGRDDIAKRAQARFRKLGMTATRERNAVLIYIVPQDQKFAVIGDRGIHERCGVTFWEAVAAGMAEGLQRGAFTDAVIGAVHRAGEELARHFPARGEGPDELPDRVERE